ncbi:DeoR family glycerol-3-phosphate regulon repressor [Luteibacter sp. Sphag1AF]|uniref:DeoR family transcriptional regulator n=1 Tax=Luteibacter sp. Sphag1AF TaxID=2587031 RepID=UPI001613C467|nr:DeoR family transcriptional regulator [Luteibacter sp. Sphag1AF]MBB3227756.1 DeoR family glycerol-3-phosphate regulon repressor [Luteibacter sp. Sphag1AF]
MEPILNRRQEELVAMVQRDGFAAVEDLAAHFDVAPQTIRRDLNLLADLGLIRRYHGGVKAPSSVENLAYTARQGLQQAEKRRLASLLASHIPDGASLFINIGTTNEDVARALLDHRGLRVITNNLNVAIMLSNNPTFEVIVAGGVVRGRDHGVTGEATIELVRQFKVDFGVIGISGIELDGTLLDFDYHEVRVAQAIIEHSRQVFLAADHSKIGRNAMVRLGNLGSISAWYTDRQPPAPLLSALIEAGTTLHIADAHN